MSVLLSTDLPFPLFRRGKVRDVYDLGKQLLIVATDRISAFDCVMPDGIPDKGRILTAAGRLLVRGHRGHRAQPLPRQPRLARRRGPYREAAGRPRHGRGEDPARCRSNASCAATWPASAGRNTRPRGTVCGMPLPRGAAPGGPAARAHLHALHQGRERATTRTSPSSAWPRSWARDLATPAAGPEPGPLPPRRGAGGRARHHAGRHQVRVRPARGRRAHPHRRSPDPRQQPLLAGRQLGAGENPPSLDKQFLRDYLETLEDWNKQAPAPHLPEAIVAGHPRTVPGSGGRGSTSRSDQGFAEPPSTPVRRRAGSSQRRSPAFSVSTVRAAIRAGATARPRVSAKASSTRAPG